MNADRVFLVAGAVLAAAGVAMGAFGAHVLKSLLSPEQMAIYQTGVQYHLWQALGLLLIGVLAGQGRRSLLLYRSGWLMLAGVIIFSGSLYAFTLTGAHWFGTLTPVGGAAMILAWLMAGLALLRR